MQTIIDYPSKTLLVKEFGSSERKFSIDNQSSELRPLPTDVLDPNLVRAYKASFVNGELVWNDVNSLRLDKSFKEGRVEIQFNGYGDERDCNINDFIVVMYYNTKRFKWHKIFYRIYSLTDKEVVLEYKRHNYEFNSVKNVNDAMKYERNEPSPTLF